MMKGLNSNQWLFFVKNKLLVKLVLVYSSIMLIPLLITIYIVNESVNSKLLELEIQSQNEITNNMKAYLDEQYSRINRSIYLIYNSADYSDSPVDTLVQMGRNENVYSYKKKNEVSNYLNRIVFSKDEILDVIVFDNHYFPNVFSTSNRSISNRYNFSEIKQIKDLRKSDRRTNIFPDESPDYIIEDDISVITHMGNLYNLNDLPSKTPVGKYIINLSSTEIMSQYLQLSGSNKATFYILRDDGVILFSNESQNTGSKYPFFDQVIHSSENEMKLHEETYILNKSRLNQKGIYLLMQAPKKLVVEDSNQLTQNIFTIFIVGVILVLILSFLYSSNIAYKIKTLHNAMRSVEKGDFDTLIVNKSNDELGQLTVAFNRMCSRLEDYVEKEYITEIKTKSAELSSLQSAINPHFLYNTIESIRMKAVEERSKEISHMLYILGKLFHWRISSEHSFITVEEEVESINWFLYLLEFRFQDGLDIKVNIDETIYECGIPKLILQPIIENAFQHGLFHKKQKSVLSIEGYQVKHKIIFDIIDNGIGMEESQLQELALKFEGKLKSNGSDQIGLTNVMRRIQVMFGHSYGVAITSKKNYWTKVSISIPAYSREEMEKNVQSFHC